METQAATMQEGRPARSAAASPRRAAGLSLRWRIVLWVALAQLAIVLVAGYLLLENAREAIREESRASQSLARNYAIASVGSLLRTHPPATALTLLPDQLLQPRHVRMHVIDGSDRPLAPQGAGETAPDGPSAPHWFRELIRPAVTVTRLPIVVAGQHYGSVVITSAPEDELAAVWANFRDLAILTVVAYLLLLAALLVGVGRAMRPLAEISRALGRLEHGDYRARLPEVTAPDLRPLTDRVNRLAAALQRALAEKDRLNHRLITLQDRERRQLSMELHDEFGPCLFGIKVEARAIADDLAGLEGPAAEAAGRARSIGAIVGQLQQVNRALLTRLRPMALGQLPLPQVLDDMLGTLAAHGPEIDWDVTIDPALGGHDETTELTVYRVLQEAVTNALRHAAPSRLEVRARLDGPGELRVEVADDGCGMTAGRREGMGLQAMRERVEGLGGRLVIDSGPGAGTRLSAAIPLARDGAAAVVGAKELPA